MGFRSAQLRRGVDGAGGTNEGAVKEDAHAESLKALRGDKAQLATDVVRIFEQEDAGLVVGGAALKPGDAFLDGTAKAGADLETLLGG